MKEEKPLVNKKYLLEKYPGKGGWTYAAIPEVLQGNHSSFGWVKVKGRIDNFEFTGFNLAPMGGRKLFFPVRKDIRKAICKEAGDVVTIVLYKDNSPLIIPQEIIECLLNEGSVYDRFVSLKEVRQKEFLDWIYSARTDETKARRIVIMMEKVLKEEGLNKNKNLK